LKNKNKTRHRARSRYVAIAT